MLVGLLVCLVASCWFVCWFSSLTCLFWVLCCAGSLACPVLLALLLCLHFLCLLCCVIPVYRCTTFFQVMAYCNNTSEWWAGKTYKLAHCRQAMQYDIAQTSSHKALKLGHPKEANDELPEGPPSKPHQALDALCLPSDDAPGIRPWWLHRFHVFNSLSWVKVWWDFNLKHYL